MPYFPYHYGLETPGTIAKINSFQVAFDQTVFDQDNRKVTNAGSKHQVAHR